ncbi:MAG: antibiotic biosynthesis monooxygenase [Spirochaetota bacterium]
MYVTTVMVHVKQEHVQDFIHATIPNHEGSVMEPGNCRFDVLQSVEDPTRFVLYEAYDSEEAAAAHKQTAHYLRWRERVEPYMAEPRKGIAYRSVRPE